MAYLFKPTKAQLHNSDRTLLIEPVLNFGIDDKGWHTAGVYRIKEQDQSIGQIHFEGTNWNYQGTALTETEQEELAYFIRFYDGKAA